MKKIFAVVAVAVLATLVGCAGEEPEVVSTTVVESETILTPDPVVTETDGDLPAATEPASDATTDGEAVAEDEEAVAEDEGMTLPKNHTVDKEGVMHAPGAENASKRCVACHGKDLDGGKAGVSCLDCHEQNWS